MAKNQLIEDLKEIYTELSFNSRWVRIAMFHLIAKRILEDGEPNENTIKKIARNLQVTPADIALALLLYEKYPNLSDLPAGKNISWATLSEYLEDIT